MSNRAGASIIGLQLSWHGDTDGSTKNHVVGCGEGLSVCVLFECCDPAGTNCERHHPAVVEYAPCALNSAAGPSDDENAVSLCQEFTWLEGFDFNISIELLKEFGHLAWTCVGAGVVWHSAGQAPDHVFGEQPEHGRDISVIIGFV